MAVRTHESPAEKIELTGAHRLRYGAGLEVRRKSG